MICNAGPSLVKVAISVMFNDEGGETDSLVKAHLACESGGSLD